MQLSVTRRTARQVADRANVVLRRQYLAFFFLIRTRLPVHVENILLFSKNFFGITVAVETPGHLQRVGLKYQRHLIDGAVTGGAAYTLVHVDAVIEIHVIRQTMHFYP